MASLFSKLSATLLPANDLWRAAKLGDVIAIKRLVAAGADVNAKRQTLNIEGKTPLHFAAENDQSEAIKVLMDLGAKVDSKDNHGTTPLMAAAAFGAHETTIDLLIDLGANLNSQDRDGLTALSWAAFGGHEHVVAGLLKRGADPNQQKGAKRSQVLTRAIESRNRNIFEMLLSAGAKVNNPIDPEPPLNTAATLGFVDFTSLLLRSGADPNSKTGSGIPAIICAVRGKSVEILKLLIGAGAEVNAQNTQGETAFDIACEIKRKDMIELLQKAGAKPGREVPERKEGQRKDITWQLHDDSVVKAVIEPWPPRPGSAVLKAVIIAAAELSDGWNVHYRMRSEHDLNKPWSKMFPVDSGDDGEEQFAAEIALAPGISLVELQVAGPVHKEPDQLRDWKITVGSNPP